MFCKNPVCRGQKEFELSDQELRLLEDFGVERDLIQFCPQCREMRRIAFRNERNFFKRKCDRSGQDIWTIYPPNSPFKVYDKDIWWGDEWDAMTYGRDIDLNRPFFQQFYELLLTVPRPSLIQAKNKNADFSNDSNANNDSYMVFTSDNNVNCHYGSFVNCKDSMDCEELFQCELCYDSIYCNTSHSLTACEYCINSSNVYFSSNLVNCHNCIFCFGLRDKKYCIFNTEVSPDVFMNFILQRQLFRRRSYKKAKEMFNMFLETVPQRYMYLFKTENSTGDRLTEVKDCENCYTSANCIACSNVAGSSTEAKDCMDCWSVAYGAQKSFENQTCLWGGFNFVCNFLTNSSNCYYSDNCQSCQHCFGCVGLKNKKYCIFNKEYTPQEYEEKKNQLIQLMKQTNEWGQFFPLWASPFPYNETVASLYHPYKKEEYAQALIESEKMWQPPESYSRSHLWNEKKAPDENTETQTNTPPDSLYEAKNEDVISAVYRDINTGEPFQITGRELALYQQMRLPLPDSNFKSRYIERLARYNPRKLHDRKCQKCGLDFKTTFPPDSPFIVFCESCFTNSLI